MHGTAGRVSQACYRSQSSVHSSGPRRRCRPRIKCRVQDHRCRARWMEPPWASSTASSLQQLACQRRLQGLGPRGEPPIPTAMPSCRLMAPGLRGSSGGPGTN